MFLSSLGNAGTCFFLKKRNFFKKIFVETNPEAQFHLNRISCFHRKWGFQIFVMFLGGGELTCDRGEENEMPC
jgi:hypothetical protein